MLLGNLKSPYGSTKKKKRVARGPGSGTGTTGGRGYKGQKSRSGGKISPSFEGGQNPLQRRLPKRGFTNIFRKKSVAFNVKDLEVLNVGDTIDLSLLQKNKKVSRKIEYLRILGTGEVKTKLTIKAHHFSKSAKEKIEKAGGKVEVV